MQRKVIANKEAKLLSTQNIKREIQHLFNELIAGLVTKADSDPVFKDQFLAIDIPAIKGAIDVNIKTDLRLKVNQVLIKIPDQVDYNNIQLLLKAAKEQGVLGENSIGISNGLFNKVILNKLNLRTKSPLEAVFIYKKEGFRTISPNNPLNIVDFKRSYQALKDIVANAFARKEKDHKSLISFFHRHIFKLGVPEQRIISLLGGDTTLKKSSLAVFDNSKKIKEIWSVLSEIAWDKDGKELSLNFRKQKKEIIKWFNTKSCHLSKKEKNELLIILKQSQSKGWRRFFINPDSEKNLVFKPVFDNNDYIENASDLTKLEKKTLQVLREELDKPGSDIKTVEKAISDSMTSSQNRHAGKYMDYVLKGLGFMSVRQGGEETSMVWRNKVLIEDSQGSIELDGKKYKEEWTKFGVAGDYDNFTIHNSLQGSELEEVGLVPLPGDVKIAIITTSLEACTKKIYNAIQNKKGKLQRSLTIPEIESIYNKEMKNVLSIIKKAIIDYECSVTGLNKEAVAAAFISVLRQNKPDETHMEISGSYQCLYGPDNLSIDAILGKADRLMNAEKNRGVRGFVRFGKFTEDRGSQPKEETPLDIIGQRRHVQNKNREVKTNNGHRDLTPAEMAKRDYLSGSLNISEIERIISSLPEGQTHVTFTVEVSKLMKLLNELLDHIGGDYNIKLEGNILRDIASAMKGNKFSGEVHVGYRFDPLILITGNKKDVARMKIKLQKYIEQIIVAEIFNNIAGRENEHEIKENFLKIAMKLGLDVSYSNAMQVLRRENSLVQFNEQKYKEILYYCFKDLWQTERVLIQSTRDQESQSDIAIAQ